MQVAFASEPQNDRGHVQSAAGSSAVLCAGRRTEDHLWRWEKWMDVEADEATFDRADVTRDVTYKDSVAKGKPILWEQWCGILARGNPKAWVCTDHFESPCYFGSSALIRNSIFLLFLGLGLLWSDHRNRVIPRVELLLFGVHDNTGHPPRSPHR